MGTICLHVVVEENKVLKTNMKKANHWSFGRREFMVKDSCLD